MVNTRHPIATAPHDGTVIRLWARDGATFLGYWSRPLQGWVAGGENVPRVRHDVTHWTPQTKTAPAGEG